MIDVLPTFDTVNGFTPEYMHSVCQGVVRQLFNLWFDLGNSDEDFYLGRKADKVDECLAEISPPSEIVRAPLSVKERKFWKVSEWQALLFYGLVVLKGLLPSLYLRYFFLLVHGVYMLLGTNITQRYCMISNAKACLIKFVSDMGILYGLTSCTFNMHQLTHLADSVNNWVDHYRQITTCFLKCLVGLNMYLSRFVIHSFCHKNYLLLDESALEKMHTHGSKISKRSFQRRICPFKVYTSFHVLLPD